MAHRGRADLRNLRARLTRRRRFTMGLVVLSVFAGACGANAPAKDSGSSLNSREQAPSKFALDRPLGIGDEWSMFFPPIRNTSDEPAILESASLDTPSGVGSAIRVESIEVGVANVPGGMYSLYPPSYPGHDGECRQVDPKPINGFVLAPGKEVLLLTRFKAVGPGDFRGSGFVVSYHQQGGETLRETFPLSIVGRVEPGATGLPIDPVEEKCFGGGSG